MTADPAAANTATREAMVEFYVAPWSEPDGRTTWCVRRFTYGPNRYERHVVSWHETRQEASTECARLHLSMQGDPQPAGRTP